MDDPRLVRFLTALGRARPSVLLYMSTTGVYGDTRGGTVTEDSPLLPSNDRSRRRVAAETAAQDWCAAHGVWCCAYQASTVPAACPSSACSAANPH